MELLNTRLPTQSDALEDLATLGPGLLIPVLDHGYVRLRDWMGSDLTPVNAARASFGAESLDLSDKDVKLIQYLAKHGHTSPFRHAMVTIEVKAPMMVARQWWKYVVGSDHTMDAWNELSFRYVTSTNKGEAPEFYSPEDWREAPANRKQGSGGNLNKETAAYLTELHRDIITQGVRSYRTALGLGVAPEQARLLLPAYGMYTTWWWTASLQSVCHYLDQRLKEDAQYEIREYALAVAEFVKALFPVSQEALNG